MIAKLAAGLLALLLALAGSPTEGKTANNILGSPLLDWTLQAQLEDQISGLEGTYGVAVKNVEDGRVVLINPQHSFPTASMYKLLVMYRVFQAADRGTLSMEDVVTITAHDLKAAEPDDDLVEGDSLTVAEALEAMVTWSSNGAAYALTRHLGGWSEVIAAGPELGMNNTVFEDDFHSTPEDMMHFFELLLDRSLVNRYASEEMISLLLRQEVNDRLPALLPSGTQIAHKTGDLEEVRNDGGIVFAPSSRYIIVVMSEGVIPEEAVGAEAEISLAVYDRYGT